MAMRRVREFIESNVQQIAVPLFEGVSTGVGKTQAWMTGMPHREDYLWLFSLAARAHMRNYWLDNLGGTGWRVVGRPELMGQTILTNHDHNLALRLIKENKRVHPGGVPVAGSGASRRQAWQEPLPGLALLKDAEVLSQMTECLLLWDFILDSEMMTVSTRVVHTIGPGRYGQRVPIDLSFVIRPHGGMFEELGFRGDPQDDDLFPDIDQEENEGGYAG